MRKVLLFASVCMLMASCGGSEKKSSSPQIAEQTVEDSYTIPAQELVLDYETDYTYNDDVKLRIFADVQVAALKDSDCDGISMNVVDGEGFTLTTLHASAGYKLPKTGQKSVVRFVSGWDRSANCHDNKDKIFAKAVSATFVAYRHEKKKEVSEAVSDTENSVWIK